MKVSSALITLTVAGAGNGGAIANAQIAIAMPVGAPPQGNVKLVIRHIAWLNNIGVNGTLLVGYADRTVAGALFRQTLVPITMINGLPDEWVDPPLNGNTREGFMIDTTAVTGSLGDIYVECTTAGIGVGTPVFVNMVAEVL